MISDDKKYLEELDALKKISGVMRASKGSLTWGMAVLLWLLSPNRAEGIAAFDAAVEITERVISEIEQRWLKKFGIDLGKLGDLAIVDFDENDFSTKDSYSIWVAKTLLKAPVNRSSRHPLLIDVINGIESGQREINKPSEENDEIFNPP